MHHPCDRAARVAATGIVAAMLLPATARAQDDDWSYRSLKRPAVPTARDAAWVHNPIDGFVLHRLEARRLRPAAPAGRIELLRRATYDLTGLPPTPDEIAAFVADDRPDSFERVVDRLLGSPQYGVKWGRHWLDLVRFAETDSYERDRKKPNAWRYRDWVVDSLNADKPYGRFLLEQLAGDELDVPTLESVVATGYYRLGIWDDEPTDVQQAIYDDYDSIVDTTARVMLGVSMGCARCHDHKKDPLQQRDYYRMLAFFENIKPYKQGGGNATTPGNYVQKIPADLGRSDFDNRLRAWREHHAADVLEVRNIADEAWSRPGPERREHARAEAGRGLVVHLTFDDAEDLGCELQGEPTVVDGRLGGALRFHGDRDGAAVERPVQDDFTIALWFKADRPGHGNATDLRWFRGSGLVDGEVNGVVDDFGIALVKDHVAAGTGRPETFLHSQGGYADGAWHHAAFTRHRETGRIVLYVDGVAVGAKTGGKQALTTPELLRIGRLQLDRRPFVGAIDDVRIYDRVLDPREVLNLTIGHGVEALTEQVVAARMGAPETARYRDAVRRLGTDSHPTREMIEVLCVQEHGAETPESFVRIRGNVHAKGDPVEPGVPAVLATGAVAAAGLAASVPEHGRSSGRRRAFAEWLVQSDHPRTWRVIANRLWQYHFGRGIIRTPNDFGALGEAPTHPHLLDWLAAELVAQGGGLKAMHRLIMTSATYRMASSEEAADPRASQVDPKNDLFWRFDPRRLTAEEIRDSILAVNGTLNLKMGGPGIYPKMPREVLETASRPNQAWGKSSPEEAARRSLYIHVKRSLLSPFLLSFDLADTDATCPVRFATTQPTQALTMMNSAFLNEQAAVLAARLRREAPGPRERVALGLRLVTQRQPGAAEIDEAMTLLRELREQDGLDDERALDCLALVLLNLNEFVCLD